MANSTLSLDMSMSTRNTAGLPRRLEKSTDFQLHVGRGSDKNVIDFTEQKLLRYALKTNDPQQKLTLVAMIEDYRNGHIAIAWKRGTPVYLRVTKDTVTAA
mgnify:CR=1 FL=1